MGLNQDNGYQNEKEYGVRKIVEPPGADTDEWLYDNYSLAV